jgi:hypothetical protein
LDQLERRYCKDTPFFRPFYIGAPKGPFLPGLIDLRYKCAVFRDLLLNHVTYSYLFPLLKEYLVWVFL